MRIVPVIQGSAAWLQSRVGLITASRLCDVMAKPKRGTEELACRRNYRMELVCERLTGRAAEHFVSRDMDWGTEQEPFARSAYEVMADVMVDEVGLVIHPTMDFFAASPDGVIGEDGGLEIKAPKTATHIDWRLAGVVPEEHEWQMFGGMSCCERSWWDFCSFDPRLPQGLRFFLSRLQRNEKRIAEMEFEVILFNEQVEEMCNRLGSAGWKPHLPGEANTETVRICDHEVPADIAQMLDASEIIP